MAAANSYARRDLFMAYPYCHWCGCEVAEPPSDPHAAGGPTMATLDHLYSRSDPRHRQSGGAAVVLACQECNQRRGRVRL